MKRAMLVLFSVTDVGLVWYDSSMTGGALWVEPLAGLTMVGGVGGLQPATKASTTINTQENKYELALARGVMAFPYSYYLFDL
jgi:hypothetical protein